MGTCFPILGMLWGKQGLLGSHSWEGEREGDTSAFNCFDRSGIDNFSIHFTGQNQSPDTNPTVRQDGNTKELIDRSQDLVDSTIDQKVGNSSFGQVFNINFL